MKNKTRKNFSTILISSVFSFFILFFIFLFLPKQVSALGCTYTRCNYTPRCNYWQTLWNLNVANDTACGSCGGYPCASTHRPCINWSYYCRTGWRYEWDRCSYDSSCVPTPTPRPIPTLIPATPIPTATPRPPTPTPTRRPTPTPDTRPDCGHTCLNHGTASVAWPDCSCTNRSPASGYTRIGTWGSRDCSQCTGYRRLAPTPTPTPRPPTPTPTPNCVCTPWVNGACGTDGGCPVGQIRRTRSCSPSGCGSTSECVVDSSCAPTCTIGYPPFTVNIQDDKTLTVNVYPNQYATGVDRVDFSESSSLIDLAPASDSTSPYSTLVTGLAEGSTNISVTSYLTPSGSCNESVPVIVLAAGPWFQTQGGHVYSDGGINDSIPDTATDRNFSIAQNNYPGIVSYNSETSVDLWEGYPSDDTNDHWLASSTYQGKRFDTWSFFTRKYGERLTENFDGTLPGADGVYYSASDKTLSGNWDLNSLPIGTWLIIMVEGDINIPVETTVPEGSFLALVAQNDIIFDGAVTQAQGMFVADNAIDTGTSDQRFDGEGIFASSSFVLGRDYEVVATNQTTPAEYFTFRPDFLISSFKDPDNNLWWFNSLWQELAP